MPDAEAEQQQARDAALAEAAAREAGTLARAFFSAIPDSWSKDDRSPVSEADHAVDRLLRARLTGLRPDYGWLSEESTDSEDRLARRNVWIVDPIDGTRAFLKHRDDWVVSIALVTDGRPVIGAIYNPIKEEMFTARLGHGAFLNDVAIHTGSHKTLADMRILATAARFEPKRWRQPWPPLDLTDMNALAYRLTLVADGRFDATATFKRCHEWDVAAADIILGEAGGVMTDADGGAIAYNKSDPVCHGTIGANPALHAAITDFSAENRLTDDEVQRRRA